MGLVLPTPCSEGMVSVDPLCLSSPIYTRPNLHILETLRSTGPSLPLLGVPPKDLQARVRSSRSGSSAKLSHPPWGPWVDNSLLGKHHSLILDLPVQGQDVVIDEWTLLGEADRGCRHGALIESRGHSGPHRVSEGTVRLLSPLVSEPRQKGL